MSSSAGNAKPTRSPPGHTPINKIEFGTQDYGAKAIVLKIWGADIGTKLALAAGRGKFYDWRTILEPVGAAEQCMHVLSGKEEQPGVAECYLCGQPTLPKGRFGKNFAHPLFPECEHILPVTTARWYLDLYMHKRQLENPKDLAILKLEYAWAHRICNQTKSNELVIKLTNPDTTDDEVEYDPAKTLAILTNIKATAGGYFKKPEIIAKLDAQDKVILDGISNIDPTTRAVVVREAKVDAIVKEINSHDPGTRGLTILQRATFLAREDLFSAPLQALVNEARASMDPSQTTAQDIVTEHAAEVETQIPQWIEESLPDYSGDGGILLLFSPFKLRGVELTRDLRKIFREALAANLEATKSQVLADVVKIIPDTFEVIALFQHNLYAHVWNALIKSGKPMKPELICVLDELLNVLNKSALADGKRVVREPTPQSVTELCAAYIEQRNKDLADIEAKLNAMTDEQYDVWSSEQDRIAHSTRSRAIAQGASIQIVESFYEGDDLLTLEIADIIAEMTDIESYREAVPNENLIDMRVRYERLTTGYAEVLPKIDAILPKIDAAIEPIKESKNADDRERRMILMNAKERLTNMKKKIDADTNPDLAMLTNIQDKIEVNRGATKLTNVSGSLKTAETNPEEASHAAALLGMQNPETFKQEGGRRTRRAKLSRHTKRARRSGPSKKLRKRSYRKSRMGKLTKKSRY